MDAAGSMTLFYTVLAFVFLILIAFIYDSLRQMRERERAVGVRTALIQSLKAIAVVTSMFAILLILFEVTGVGNPILYLSVGLLSLRRLRYMGNTHGMVSNDTNLP